MTDINIYSKTFSSKSNAKRAALKAGLAAEMLQLERIPATEHAPEVWCVVEPGDETAATEVAEVTQEDVQAAADHAETEIEEQGDETPRKGVAIQKDREERNGYRRPSAGGKCAAVWDYCDWFLNDNGENIPPKPKDLKHWAEKHGHNPNNAVIELYQWRKFMGLSK